MVLKKRHKWLLAGAMLISIAAWLACTLLAVQSDLTR
jgi:hypothetical protein